MITIFSLTETKQTFELKLDCECGQPTEKFKFEISGLIIYFASQMFAHRMVSG